MTKVISRVGYLCAIVTVVLAAGIYMSGDRWFGIRENSSDADQPISTGKSQSLNVLQVTTTVAERSSSYEKQSTYSGIVKARRAGDLGFTRTGRLEISVRVGQRVAAGDLIAEIDSSRLREQKKQLESAMQQGEEALAKRVAAARLTTLEAMRMEVEALKSELKELREGKGDELNQSRIDDAQARVKALELVSRDPQVVEEQAELRSLTEQLAQLQIEIDEHAISAPYDGIIATVYSNDGVLVSPGVPIVRIVESDAFEVAFALPAEVAASVELGESRVVQVGEQQYDASAIAKLPELEQTGRTRSVLFSMTTADASPILAGEVAQLEITQVVEESGYWLPLTSLIRDASGLWSVYTVNADEKGNKVVARQYLEVRFLQGDRARVQGTLDDGSQVIAEGVHRVVPGQIIKVKAAELPDESVEGGAAGLAP